VTFIDSIAIAVLVVADKRAITSGGAIVLHGVQPQPMKVMEITGLAITACTCALRPLRNCTNCAR
jgi:anti-anti-sigma factor